MKEFRKYNLFIQYQKGFNNTILNIINYKSDFINKGF